MTETRIIDFHDHPGPAVAERQRQLGIDISVLLSVGPDGLETALRMSAQDPQRYVPFYWVDPFHGDEGLAEEPGRVRGAVRESEVRGVKFQPMDQHWFADDRRLYPIYEVCVELGLVCTWHCGVVNLSFKYELGVPMLARYTTPLPLDQVAFDFPELNLCIAHLGGNYTYEALVLAEKHERIYLDTAFLPFFAPRMFPATTPEAWIAHAVRVAGAEKVLYGGEGTTPDHVRGADIPGAAQGLVLGGNAARLLGR